MKHLNLFRSIKNISYLTAFACLPLSSLQGTTPREIIEAYAEDQDLAWVSGNVLAYKNINGDTIVLKSGNDFRKRTKGHWELEEGKRTLEYATDVTVVSLAKVLEYTAKHYDYKENLKYQPSQSTLAIFGDCCKKDNADWYEYISRKDPYCFSYFTYYYNQYTRRKIYKEHFIYTDPCIYIQNCYAKDKWDIHTRLGNFRHTEIQVQALWNTYCECKDEKIKKEIASLLPIALTAPENKDNKIDDKIYSLFEACDACKRTSWLNGGDSKKDKFMFRIADGQIANHQGRYKVKGNDFMSQETLEKAIKTNSKRQFLNKNFKKLY